ncbi:MAG: DUF4349 domain-containing protein [Clostridiales bacterium]|jgi:hypothetical protein|nr:DUF4349 domain-containing protein [Clostridiales bacterium]
MKRNIKIILICLAAVLVLAFIIAACAGGSERRTMSAPQPAADSFFYENSISQRAAEEEGMPAGDYGYAEPPAPAAAPMESAAGISARETSAGADRQNLMFIKTASVATRTDNFDGDIINIRNTVNSYGGYFESSNMFTNYTRRISDTEERNYRIYHAVVRVPVENYEAAKKSLEAIGVLYQSGESTQEVSGEYFDTQSRLETARTEEQRLLELIDETADLKLLIEIERRLGEVKTQIELYESRLSRLENQTSYSTISLNVTEAETEDLLPVTEESFLTKLGDGFTGSVDATVKFFQNAAVFLSYILIPAAILAVLVFAGIFIAKTALRKERAAKS